MKKASLIFLGLFFGLTIYASHHQVWSEAMVISPVMLGNCHKL